MRYRVQLFEPNEDTPVDNDDWVDQNSERYREDDVHILARVGVDTIQYNFTNGTKVILGPLEYECEWCDAYGHNIDSCPLFAESDTPFNPEDYEQTNHPNDARDD